jgi:hypothetical protein
LDPDRWDALSDEGKERAMAYMMEQGEMDAVEAYEADKKNKQPAPKRGRSKH